MSWVKFIVISLLFVGSGIALKLFANPFERGETLPPEKVKMRWGTIADYKAFKSSDDAGQSKMAYSIMTDKSLIGKSIKEVKEIFGKPDGFYFLDRFPAYIIQEGKNKTEDTWQIVFKLDGNSKVKDVVVHKNCCDRN